MFQPFIYEILHTSASIPGPCNSVIPRTILVVLAGRIVGSVVVRWPRPELWWLGRGSMFRCEEPSKQTFALLADDVFRRSWYDSREKSCLRCWRSGRRSCFCVVVYPSYRFFLQSRLAMGLGSYPTLDNRPLGIGIPSPAPPPPAILACILWRLREGSCPLLRW